MPRSSIIPKHDQRACWDLLCLFVGQKSHHSNFRKSVLTTYYQLCLPSTAGPMRSGVAHINKSSRPRNNNQTYKQIPAQAQIPTLYFAILRFHFLGLWLINSYTPSTSTASRPPVQENGSDLSESLTAGVVSDHQNGESSSQAVESSTSPATKDREPWADHVPRSISPSRHEATAGR